MSKALDQAIARLTPGTRLEVVEQTKRPVLVGSTRTVIRRSSKLVFETANVLDGEIIESAMELPASNTPTPPEHSDEGAGE